MWLSPTPKTTHVAGSLQDGRIRLEVPPCQMWVGEPAPDRAPRSISPGLGPRRVRPRMRPTVEPGPTESPRPNVLSPLPKQDVSSWGGRPQVPGPRQAHRQPGRPRPAPEPPFLKCEWGLVQPRGHTLALSSPCPLQDVPTGVGTGTVTGGQGPRAGRGCRCQAARAAAACGPGDASFLSELGPPCPLPQIASPCPAWCGPCGCE